MELGKVQQAAVFLAEALKTHRGDLSRGPPVWTATASWGISWKLTLLKERQVDSWTYGATGLQAGQELVCYQVGLQELQQRAEKKRQLWHYS